ncbi:MAG TPA: TIGR02300 family protein [Alphaproteobacteria bacterium]
MAKPEWGTKHTCRECGAKFYDMRRSEIVCPKCGTEFVPTATKTRRTRPEPEPEPETPAKAPAMTDDAAESGSDEAFDGIEEVEDADGKKNGDETEDMIEDASDLGDDEEDVAEVMENVDGEKDA